MAVLTRGELAIEKAIFFASASVLQLVTLIVINLDAPSPSATIRFAKFNKTLFREYQNFEVFYHKYFVSLGFGLLL